VIDPKVSGNLSRMAFGHATSQIIYAAVRLGVPEALADGPLAAGELARALDCDPDGLTRLVRALTVLGLLDEAAPGRFALAEPGRLLCAGHPRSIRASVLLLGDPVTWRAWGALTEGVRTGGAAFDRAHGRPLFDHLADDPELSDLFNAAMGEGTEWTAREVPRAYDFTGARTVVDIGGGNGTLLAAVLRATPDARGVLFDSAQGSAAAAETFRGAGLAPDRWSIEAGDFFQAVPRGDVLLVKGILHDWDDERCAALLRNCRKAIAPDGRLLVVEPVLPDRLDAQEAAGVVMSDIAMLVYTGGRERSRDEFRALLADGGFRLLDVTRRLAATPVRILVAAPD
jgi:SAM-dependent methyltransferase